MNTRSAMTLDDAANRVVRTVMGDVRPSELGPTYVHEHLIIDSRLVAAAWPEIHLDSEDVAIEELTGCYAVGVRAMVDAMPAGAGRDAVRLARVSAATGVHIIAATGLHTVKYYEQGGWTDSEPADQLARIFVADIKEGIDRYDYMGPLVRRSSHRAGIIKVATMDHASERRDRTLFEGAAIAHHETGVPIMTHCEDGLDGMKQVEWLADLDVSLSHVMLSHTDKVVDPSYHLDLLDTGVNLEFDQSLRRAARGDSGVGPVLEATLSEGYVDQLMLGTDGARRSLWTALGGGPGLAWLLRQYEKLLEPQIARALFVSNPSRYLSFDIGFSGDLGSR